MTLFVAVALISLVVVMIHRGLNREFPFFFAYLFVVLGGEAVRQIFLYRYLHGYPYIHYFYAYWITEAGDVLLAFLVLYEVFLIRLFPGFNITPLYRYLFPIAGLSVLGLTFYMFASAPSHGPGKLAVIVGEFTLALSFMQVAVLAFFCVLFLFMSREWTRHEFGIALGFGLYASIKLLIALARANRAYASTKFEQAHNAAYLVSALIWLFYLSKAEPEPEKTVITQEMVDKVDVLYQEMRHLLRKRSRPKGS